MANDFFVKGYNVCHHTDLMTHNHGSDPGNTGVWRYLDTADKSTPCKKDKKRVETECGVTKNENKEFQKQIKRHNELIEKSKR